MENRSEFYETVESIVERDPRYRPEAYSFVMLALGFTVASLDAPRHVTGQELLEGIRRYALQEFGPMAKTVFEHWGIQRTADFGRVVFNLIEAGLLGKTETDRPEDFEGGYDFEAAFVRDYPWDAPLGRPE
ncbi:MAG TPA: Minf_1886 family protein [Candidatus Saccharimonadales bacterium]|nr:Minf_1886 family protein [Candidatus Saccharimonadales bacterium]